MKEVFPTPTKASIMPYEGIHNLFPPPMKTIKVNNIGLDKKLHVEIEKNGMVK